jgi:CheY-like chemotaxis protein
VKAKPLMKKNILVVDDDQMYVELVREVSVSDNVSVIAAHHGKEALAILKGRRVDLIISDIIMPVMDGLTFHMEVLKDKNLATIPFVFITGAADEAVLQHIAQTPGVRLISKTNLVNELAALLSHLQ